MVEIRTIFKACPPVSKNEGNIAVVVGNQDYQGDLPDHAYGHADADAVRRCSTDQLGYKQENIIDLRDATLADFERVFGSESNPAANSPSASTRRIRATSSSMSRATAW